MDPKVPSYLNNQNTETFGTENKKWKSDKYSFTVMLCFGFVANHTDAHTDCTTADGGRPPPSAVSGEFNGTDEVEGEPGIYTYGIR